MASVKSFVALAATCVVTAAPSNVVQRRVVTDCVLPDMRPSQTQRTFISPAVDAAIESMVPKFKDQNLATLFANALPNALDTTVYRHTGPNDTYIVTGDITAMWLRDSTNQVLPYLRFVAADSGLRDLIAGLIARQARSILLDPYANAFQIDDLHGQGPHSDDSTSRAAYAGTTVSAMTPAIFERKWEVDSLSNHLRLSYEYWNASSDTAPFTSQQWISAVQTIFDTFVSQQQDTDEEDSNGGPAYTFQRQASNPSDTLQQGRGYPVRRTGMIKGGFRGSDDASVLNFNIPENAFTAAQLRRVSELLTATGQDGMSSQALALAMDIEAGIAAHAVINHPVAGKVLAFEVDGFGNAIFMDDANIPSLLALPMYGGLNFSTTDPLYLATRAGVLSRANPFFFNGTAAAGIGGPHNGPYFVWPMALIAQAWTSNSDTEIAGLLETLLGASACTGLVHESFDRNSFFSYTRPWFAWANSLFASLILKIADERPYLIFTSGAY